MLNDQVIKPPLELSVVLYGLEKDEVGVEQNAIPLALPVPVASLVNSSCSGEVFLLAPKSPVAETLHELAPMAPLVVNVALVLVLKSSEKTVVCPKLLSKLNKNKKAIAIVAIAAFLKLIEEIELKTNCFAKFC
jgi:hypothetical protein